MTPGYRYRALLGVGGIGWGMFFALDGDHDLGRNESRPGRLLDVRDYCKLHIVCHYISVLLGKDGFRVLPIGRIGDDNAGHRMLEEMSNVGIDTAQMGIDSEHPTLFSVCFQYSDGSGGNITSSNSAAAALRVEDAERALRNFDAQADPFLALAAPEAPLEVRHRFLQQAAAKGAFCAGAFTSAEIPQARELGMFRFADLISMNEDEAGTLAEEPFDPAEPGKFLARCAERLAEFRPDIRLVVSAGAMGAFGQHADQWEHCPAPRVPVSSTAGAGDALLAGVLAGLTVGAPFIDPETQRPSIAERPLTSALDLGVLLASYTVTSPHTIHPEAGRDTLKDFASRMHVQFSGPLGRLFFTR